MKIAARCPNSECQREFRIPAAAVGRKATCNHCGTKFRIPQEVISNNVATDERSNNDVSQNSLPPRRKRKRPDTSVARSIVGDGRSSGIERTSDKVVPDQVETSGWPQDIIAKISHVSFVIYRGVGPILTFYQRLLADTASELFLQFSPSQNATEDPCQIGLSKHRNYSTANWNQRKQQWHVALPDSCLCCGNSTPQQRDYDERLIDPRETWPLIIKLAAAVYVLSWFGISVWVLSTLSAAGAWYVYAYTDTIRVRIHYGCCDQHIDQTEFPQARLWDSWLLIRVGDPSIGANFVSPKARDDSMVRPEYLEGGSVEPHSALVSADHWTADASTLLERRQPVDDTAAVALISIYDEESKEPVTQALLKSESRCFLAAMCLKLARLPAILAVPMAVAQTIMSVQGGYSGPQFASFAFVSAIALVAAAIPFYIIELLVRTVMSLPSSDNTYIQRYEDGTAGLSFQERSLLSCLDTRTISGFTGASYQLRHEQHSITLTGGRNGPFPILETNNKHVQRQWLKKIRKVTGFVVRTIEVAPPGLSKLR